MYNKYIHSFSESGTRAGPSAETCRKLASVSYALMYVLVHTCKHECAMCYVHANMYVLHVHIHIMCTRMFLHTYMYVRTLYTQTIHGCIHLHIQLHNTCCNSFVEEDTWSKHTRVYTHTCMYAYIYICILCTRTLYVYTYTLYIHILYKHPHATTRATYIHARLYKPIHTYP
jgi:hypothetical protein